VTFFAISKSGVRVPSIDDVIVGDYKNVSAIKTHLKVKI